jgi:putative tryptophan/tyrosine transport system substrate-binding protein
VRVVTAKVSTGDEIGLAVASLMEQRVSAMLPAADILFVVHYDMLVALAARHALPAIYPFREFALAGGLMSYGSSLGYSFLRAGIYTGRILKGEKPADLPVEQATKIELVINVKMARTLGLNVPPTVLAIADEVIE